MSQNEAYDFTKLYRAAFAERNPDRKLVLLGQVQRAIQNWEQATEVPAKRVPSDQQLAPRIALTA